jgi:hypothetical protein
MSESKKNKKNKKNKKQYEDKGPASNRVPSRGYRFGFLIRSCLRYGKDGLIVNPFLTIDQLTLHPDSNMYVEYELLACQFRKDDPRFVVPLSANPADEYLGTGIVEAVEDILDADPNKSDFLTMTTHACQMTYNRVVQYVGMHHYSCRVKVYLHPNGGSGITRESIQGWPDQDSYSPISVQDAANWFLPTYRSGVQNVTIRKDDDDNLKQYRNYLPLVAPFLNLYAHSELHTLEDYENIHREPIQGNDKDKKDQAEARRRSSHPYKQFVPNGVQYFHKGGAAKSYPDFLFQSYMDSHPKLYVPDVQSILGYGKHDILVKNNSFVVSSRNVKALHLKYNPIQVVETLKDERLISKSGRFLLPEAIHHLRHRYWLVYVDHPEQLDTSALARMRGPSHPYSTY